MSIQIRELQSASERRAVYRFRYDIYVREMRRVQKYADHEHATIEEPLDNTGHVLAAFDVDSVVGTVRVNYAREGDIGYYVDLYQMRRFTPFFPDRTCINTKLMTGPDHRNSSLGLRLARSSYALATADGMRLDFIDCNLHLVPFFARMGYRQIQAEIVHPEYGHVHPMVLVTHDIPHLRSVKSPFLSAAAGSDFGSVQFFYDSILGEKGVDAWRSPHYDSSSGTLHRRCR